MLIEPKALKHWIDNFYGYGSWKARFWFIGPEESGGDTPEEVAGKLNYFNQQVLPDTHSLCDIRDLYDHVPFRADVPAARKFANLNDYRFGTNATLHGAWKNMIAFEHAYDGRNVPDLLTYQRKTFALGGEANEALISLYPLPAHNHAWYYSWLDLPDFPFLKTRAAYREHVYPGRISHLLEKMKAYKPEVVLMYGMDNVNDLKFAVQHVFPDAEFRSVKAIKRKIPQHHFAKLDETAFVITTQVPALRHNRVETGFDWFEFGGLVKEYMEA